MTTRTGRPTHAQQQQRLTLEQRLRVAMQGRRNRLDVKQRDALVERRKKLVAKGVTLKLMSDILEMSETTLYRWEIHPNPVSMQAWKWMLYRMAMEEANRLAKEAAAAAKEKS